MQNKPNLLSAEMNITSAIAKHYENIPPTEKCENKPNQTQFQYQICKTNPIEPDFYTNYAKQTQSNPILSAIAFAKADSVQKQPTPPQTLTHFNISLQFGYAIFHFQNKFPLAKILLYCIIHFMNETYTIRPPHQAILGLTTLLLRRKAL